MYQLSILRLLFDRSKGDAQVFFILPTYRPIISRLMSVSVSASVISCLQVALSRKNTSTGVEKCPWPFEARAEVGLRLGQGQEWDHVKARLQLGYYRGQVQVTVRSGQVKVRSVSSQSCKDWSRWTFESKPYFKIFTGSTAGRTDLFVTRKQPPVVVESGRQSFRELGILRAPSMKSKGSWARERQCKRPGTMC